MNNKIKATTHHWYSIATPDRTMLWLILISTAYRLFTAAFTGLGNSESYYFAAVDHPQLSYFDHPPLAFWIAWVSVKLTGVSSTLTLRLPFIILFIGTTWMMYQLGRRLFDPWTGVYAAFIMNLAFLFTGPVAIWLQPDGPLMFFWLATILCLLQIFFPYGSIEHTNKNANGSQWGWWLAAGVSLGLTLLSKYHAVFLPFGVSLFALTHRDVRRWIFHPGPYVAILIAVSIASPIWVWNYLHEWISLGFQASRATASASRWHFDWLARSIGGQALWLLPWVWLPLICQLPYSFYFGRSKSSTAKGHWFCACTAIGPILFFSVITLWSNTGFHFHWQAPGYMMLFPPLGWSVKRLLHRGSRLVRRWLIGSTVFTVLALLVMTTHMVFGWWRIYGPEWLAAQFGEAEDPTLEGLDYNELSVVLSQYGLLERDDVFVFTSQVHLAGKIYWALRGQLPCTVFNQDPRNLAFFYRPRNWLGWDAVLVSRGEDIPCYLPGYFDSITRLSDVVIHRWGRPVITLRLYFCHNYYRLFPLPYPKINRDDTAAFR